MLWISPRRPIQWVSDRIVPKLPRLNPLDLDCYDLDWPKSDVSVAVIPVNHRYRLWTAVAPYTFVTKCSRIAP
jgi:hypothetical protein